MSSEKSYYENKEHWEPDAYLNEADERKRFLESLEQIPEDIDSLLDVGCGNGAFLKFLEEENKNLRLNGLERSQISISKALCRTSITEGRAEKMPFQDNEFDIVCSLEAIEHFPFKIYEDSLSEIARIAKKYILISVPYNERRFHTQCPYCSCAFTPSYHMRSYDENNLENLFSGFQLTSFKKVMVKDYLLGDSLRQLKPQITYPWQGGFVCPQCAYSSSGSSPVNSVPQPKPTSGGLKQGLKSAVKALLPKVQRAKWILALYQSA